MALGVAALCALAAGSSPALGAPGTGPSQASSLEPTAVRDAFERGAAAMAAGTPGDAVAAYRQLLGDSVGPSGAAHRPIHPTLAYNLATALHHQGELAEAVLWYRRGDAEDPWLQENLWLARRSLGSQRLPATGPLRAEHGTTLRRVGVVCAWLALLAGVVALVRSGRFGGSGLPERPSRLVSASLAGLVVLALVSWFAGGWLLETGERQGVLVADCGDALPAGTEAWARPSDTGWTLGDLDCPAPSFVPIVPQR